jgi:hypothetical protein
VRRSTGLRSLYHLLGFTGSSQHVLVKECCYVFGVSGGAPPVLAVDQ